MVTDKARVEHANILIVRGLALIREGCKQLVSLRATIHNPLADTLILGKGHNPDAIPDKVKIISKKGLKSTRSSVIDEKPSTRARKGTTR